MCTSCDLKPGWLRPMTGFILIFENKDGNYLFCLSEKL